MLDLYERIRGRVIEGDRALFVSRMLTLVWGIVFILFANLFKDQNDPVVELGLAIASFTYGGLLGVFLLGLVNKATDQKDALIAFVVTIAFMVWVIFAVWFSPTEGWIIDLAPSDEAMLEGGLRAIGWPWYTVIGSMVTLAVGSLLALRHR
jgi:Na+(H+)/acetate symporter ActP